MILSEPLPESLAESGDEGPVTVSISRRVRPGCEQAYEDWLSGVIQAASEFSGHLGCNILRPSAATQHEYVIIYRFDNYLHCQRWEQSTERERWVAKLAPLVVGDAVMQRGTGLEFWFNLPELPVQHHPSPHKMVLVLVTVVFVLVLLLNWVLAPLLLILPYWLKTLTVVVLQVVLMTYWVMPRMTRLLREWLFKL